MVQVAPCTLIWEALKKIQVCSFISSLDIILKTRNSIWYLSMGLSWYPFLLS
jgi:hypothetical protein